MSNVIQLYTWSVHLAHPDDEWESLCGEASPELLMEQGSEPLPGYSVCEACSKISARFSSMSISTTE